MKRRLIALLLCISLIGSMTVYAVDDVTEPTVPETSAPASEPTVPETSEAASEPTVPETSAPASEPTVPETSAPASEPTVPETSVPAADPTEPSQVDVPAGPAVGDTIYIKSGSYVYKATVEENGHLLLGNYTVKIKEIITDELGAPAWYKFEFTSLGLGELWLSFSGYQYVKVENTTITDPEQPSEPTTPTVPDDSDTVTTDDGNTVVVDGIPRNAKLQIDKADDSVMNTIADYIGEQTAGEVETPLFAYDITIVDENGDEWQPGDEPVTVTLTIPELTIGLYQKICIAHMHDGEVKMVENVEMDLENDTISFTTDGFSEFVGSFVDFSSSVKDSIMLIPGTAEALVDILEAIAPETYLKYTVPTDVESVTVDPADCGITWNTSYAITAPTDFGYDEATLTVKMKAVEGIAEKTYTIRVLRGEAIFALEGAHTNWNQAATTTKTVTAQDTEITKTVKAFDSTIHVNTDKYSGDTDDIIFGSNYKIYMRPGMAVTISNGLHLYTDAENPTYFPNLMEDNMTAYEDFGSFTWMWESPINYIIANDVQEYTVVRFQLRNGTDTNDTRVRTIELHIIPDNDPELLRNYLNQHQNDVTKNYSIKEVPATLFDYDGLEWNTHYYNQFNNGNYFAFVNQDAGKSTDPNLYGYKGANQANAGGYANQGLLHWKLNDNGLPVMQQTHGVDLFSITEISGRAGQPKAKEVYENVGFEFIYDSDGYYNYNSELNHAQYNDSNNKIELYTQSLSPSDSNNITYNWADQNPKAGFYPFADINEAFYSIDAPGMTVEEKLEKLKNSVDLNNRLNSDLAKDFVHSNKAGSTVGMFYGIHVHSDFYLPADKQLNGHDMVYEFTGDDDLWVFIDGQLVLDVGGGHTPVSGSFNLTTGEVWVEKFVQLTSDAGGYYTDSVTVDALDKNNLSNDNYFTQEETFLKNLQGDQMHTISIFYLERFAGESNCRMRFNLPLVPSESVHVSKNLVNQEGLELSVTPDVDYTFTLYTAEGQDSYMDDVVNATSFNAKANAPYTVLGVGAPTDTQYTDSNGQFKLKDGWTASFSGIPRFSEVYVVESNPNDGYQYPGHTISVNRGTATDYTPDNNSETKIMKLNSSISFDFVNKMQTQPLTVEKQVVNGKAGLINPEQKFDFTLDFTQPILETGEGAIKAENSVNLTDGGTFLLGHDESVTIPRVPVNMTFTLKEANPDTENSSFDAPKFESTICTAEVTPNAFDTDYTWIMVDGGANKVKVINQQRFNLTIEKTGIEEVDNDSDDQQSTIFTVVGKIGDDVIVNMDVAICGNNSVTICKLPVGSYTVVENTDWSWRYDPFGGDLKNVTISQDAKATVIYDNDRTKQEWLSGDCYCENWWGKNSASKPSDN